VQTSLRKSKIGSYSSTSTSFVFMTFTTIDIAISRDSVPDVVRVSPRGARNVTKTGFLYQLPSLSGLQTVLPHACGGLGYIENALSRSIEDVGGRYTNPYEQSKSLSNTGAEVGGSVSQRPGTWQHCYAQDIYSTHLSGFPDHSGDTRLKLSNVGLSFPALSDIRVCGSCRTPGGIIHSFLRARRCFRTAIALTPMVP
jgi:hypothetical protein